MDAAEKKVFASQFYSRQIALKELGEKGQQQLSQSKVAVVGVGGLGTVSSFYLALSGVGYLTLNRPNPIETRNPLITFRSISPAFNDF